jgi:hypothetical protein
MRKKLLLFFQSLLIFGLVLSAFSFIKKDTLYTLKDFHFNIDEPVQYVTDKKPFMIIKGNTDYKIFPKYNYKLEGLVVSTYSSSNWWEIYNSDSWGDYLNVKDICVIWGENIYNELYKKMFFSSSRWACYAYSQDKNITEKFNPNKMSNNHLLADNPGILKKIFKTNIGDVIHLEGMLVDYCYNNCKYSRETSVKRNDNGSGACETVFVTDYKILKSSNVIWGRIFAYAKLITLLSIFGITAILVLKKK